ncbi:MAG: hypothetical protein AAGA37_13860 [Actinomycetota bacterium]
MREQFVVQLDCFCDVASEAVDPVDDEPLDVGLLGPLQGIFEGRAVLGAR